MMVVEVAGPRDVQQTRPLERFRRQTKIAAAMTASGYESGEIGVERPPRTAKDVTAYRTKVVQFQKGSHSLEH